MTAARANLVAACAIPAVAHVLSAGPR